LPPVLLLVAAGRRAADRRALVPGRAVGGRRPGRREHPAERGRDERGGGREVAAQRGPRDAGGPGDRLDGDRRSATRGEQGDGGVQQLAAGAGASRIGRGGHAAIVAIFVRYGGTSSSDTASSVS